MKTEHALSCKSLIVTVLCLLFAFWPKEAWGEEITTKSGKEYTGVTVTGHDEAYLEILHDAGGAKIHFEDLPEEYQKKYKYNRYRVWFTDYKMAQKISEESGRPMLVFISGSDWEVALPKGVKSDPKKPQRNKTQQVRMAVLDTNRFKKYAEQKLVLFEGDMPKTKPQPPEIRKQNTDLAAKFGVQEPPALFLLNADGDQIGTLEYNEKGGLNEFMAMLENLVMSTEQRPESESTTNQEAAEQKVAQSTTSTSAVTSKTNAAPPAESKEEAKP